MPERPDPKPRLAVDPAAADRTKESRVLRTIAVVSHDEIFIRTHQPSAGIAVGPAVVIRPGLGKVGLVEHVSVDVDDPAVDQDALTRQPDDPFDEVGRVVGGRPQDDDVSALRCVQPVVDLVRDQVVVVVQRREHRQTFDVHRLDGEADPEVEDHREDDDLGDLSQQRRGRGTFLWGGASRLLVLGRHACYETSLAQTRSSSSRLE